MSNRRQEEEKERIESEISLLGRRLASLRVQLQVNQREREAAARTNRQRRQGRLDRGVDNNEQTLVVGSRVQVTNRRDELYGEEGTITQISRGQHFVYFRLDNGTVRYRRPQNLVVVAQQDQNE